MGLIAVLSAYSWDFPPAKSKLGLSNFLSRSINLFEVRAWEAEQVDTWGCLVQVQ